MRTIWKFPLVVADNQFVRMPKGAQVLDVQMQGPMLCLWALVDPDAPTKDITVRIIGTGHDIYDDLWGYRHVSTFQLSDGKLVFHVFVE